MVLQLLDEMEADGGLSLSTLGAGPLAAAAISVKHGGLGFSLTDCAVLQRELAMRSPSPSTCIRSRSVSWLITGVDIAILVLVEPTGRQER